MRASIDDRRVRYLYEAVITGSVRAAADKLDMNASVISRQIAKLEEELAVTLLERYGRGVKPTDAGRMLVEYSRQHRSHQDDVVAKLQEVRGLARGHIDIVLGEGFVSDLMAEPIQDFWSRHPGLTIAMTLAGTNDVLRMVEEDAAHIGLVYNAPLIPGIRTRTAIRQSMCVVAAPEHPLTRLGKPLLLRQLASYPIALMQGSYGTRQVIQVAEQLEKLRLFPKLTTNSISVIKHFVRAELGISLLPAFAISQEIDAGQLVALPIDNAILISAEAQIVTRLGRQLSPAANKLLLHLVSGMRAFHAAPRPGRGRRPAIRQKTRRQGVVAGRGSTRN